MIFDQIHNDYIKARKEREHKKSEFLGFLRSELSNYAKKIQKDKLNDEETIKILMRLQKKLKEAKQVSQKSNRKDIQASISSELEIISNYLPKPLSPEKINQIIDETISENQAKSLADMGKIIKLVLEKVGTRSDPQYISKTTKEKLSSL